MNLIEKDITIMKNQQAVEGDTIVIVEVLAIEANTVETITRIMTGDTGVNTNADMSILTIGGHTHQNTGEEITTMIMNQDQDHQHIPDIELNKKTARIEEGEAENRLIDDERKDQDTTHLMTAIDMKNIKVHIANRRPYGMKN